MPAYSLQEGFRQMLVADAGLIALVAAARITADFAPGTTAADGPWIVIDQVSGSRPSGSMEGDGGMRFARFQLEIGGASRETVLAVQDYLSESFESVEFTDTTQVGHVRKLVTFIADDGTDWEEGSQTFKSRIDIEVQSDKTS
jgi:hypothetical protein